jgi:hypothetical protein
LIPEADPRSPTLPMAPKRLTRRLRPAALGLIVTVLGVLFPASSGAAPVSYFPLPGGPTNTIDDLTVASDGTLWMAQTLSTGPANTERHMRLLHVSHSGALLGVTPEQEGDPLFTEMVPAGDGGVWVNAGGLEHVAPDGSVRVVPHGGGTNLVAGKDGRAWLQRCNFISGHPEECMAIAVDTAGEVETYGLSGLSAAWPPGATGASEVHNSVATQSGIWFWKLFRGDGGPIETYAEFISYQGAGTPIATLPAESFLVAPAGGDSAWWLKNEPFAGATIGEVDTGGQTSNIHHMGNLSELPEHPDGFVADPGRDGGLIWAQNATWNDEFDGQIGVAGLDGSNTGFAIEHDATAVPTSTPDFWSGSCTFGVRTFQAADGSLWTISGGHPPRLTRQQPTGQFSTFLLNGASEFNGEQETGVWGMDETGPHELWFTLNSPQRPELARLDPLDPPPAEPRMPKDETGSGITGQGHGHARDGHRRGVSRLLRSLTVQIGAQLRHPAEVGGRLSLKAHFPVPGVIQVKVTGRRGKRSVGLAGGKLEGAGQLTMLIPFRAALRHLLRGSSVGTRVAISVSFRESGGRPVLRASSMRLPG